MGSGENRNNKDTVIIRRPKKILDGISSVAAGVSIADVAADICPAAFKVKLKANPHIRPGAIVRLTKQSGIYLILLSTTEVGRLNTTQSATVDRCDKLGVKYHGVIVIINDQPYATFSRKL